MSRCIALLRGINVGRAKRIAMADLRALLEGLGATDVRTFLNSGNAVFDVAQPAAGELAPAIEAEIRRRFGFSAAVVVHTASQLKAIVAENPLERTGRDPARLLVAFVTTPATLRGAKPLLAERWAPEALALGSRAAYLWCAGGIAESRLMQAFARATGDAATARNWATVLKLHAAASGDRDER
jgi:uncharacterized protein (DUF1697 family)